MTTKKAAKIDRPRRKRVIFRTLNSVVEVQ
jgi:hypothetical protein